MTDTLDRQFPPASGTPGVVPLRPLLVGEILDGAVSAMRSYPGIMLGLSAVVVAVGQIIAIPLDFLYDRFLTGLVSASTDRSGANWINGLAVARPGVLIGFATAALLAGVLTVTVSRAVLGRPITLDEVWRLARPQLWRLLGLTLVVYGTLIGVFALCVTPGVLLLANQSSSGSGPGALLMFLGCVGGFVFVLHRYISWSLAGVALMLEQQPIRAALRRSTLLVKGGWWRIFGILLLATLVTYLVTGILLVIQQRVGSNLAPVTDNSDGTVTAHQVTWASVGIDALFTTAVQAVTAPFLAAVTALQYIDRRMRREALDIQLTRSVNRRRPAS